MLDNLNMLRKLTIKDCILNRDIEMFNNLISLEVLEWTYTYYLAVKDILDVTNFNLSRLKNLKLLLSIVYDDRKDPNLLRNLPNGLMWFIHLKFEISQQETEQLFKDANLTSLVELSICGHDNNFSLKLISKCKPSKIRIASLYLLNRLMQRFSLLSTFRTPFL